MFLKVILVVCYYCCLYHFHVDYCLQCTKINIHCHRQSCSKQQFKFNFLKKKIWVKQ
jgi:hypothetical protein